jgi:hypothetical protein
MVAAFEIQQLSVFCHKWEENSILASNFGAIGVKKALFKVRSGSILNAIHPGVEITGMCCITTVLRINE